MAADVAVYVSFRGEVPSNMQTAVIYATYLLRMLEIERVSRRGVFQNTKYVLAYV